MLMKTKLIYLFGMLALLLSATGCDKEDTLTIPYYAEMEDEVITKEVENISGYVVCKELDCVFICYSEYADEYALEYFKNGLQVNHNMNEAIQKDLKAHTIGVAKTDFEKSRLPIPCKVYFSASITNNDCLFGIGNYSMFSEPQAFPGTAFCYKAYLKNIKQRN